MNQKFLIIAGLGLATWILLSKSNSPFQFDKTCGGVPHPAGDGTWNCTIGTDGKYQWVEIDPLGPILHNNIF